MVLKYNWPGPNAASPDHPMAVRLSDGTAFGASPNSTKNTTTTLLGPGATFTGEAEEILPADNWRSVTVTAFSDVASAIDGLSIEWGPDGANWDQIRTRTVEAGQSVQVVAEMDYRFFRVVYTNGGSAQAEFRLHTTFGNKTPIQLIDPNSYPYKFVRAQANGGNKSLAQDGSVTPVDMIFTREDNDVSLHRILVSWSDDGTWRSERFAGFSSALSNGCELEYTRDGVTIGLLDGISIKNNFDMESLMFDVDIQSLGAGDTFLSGRFTMDRFGEPIVLRKGDSVIWRINDDLTPLLEGRVILEGDLRV